MKIELINKKTKETRKLFDRAEPDMLLSNLPRQNYAAIREDGQCCGVFSLVFMGDRTVINRLFIDSERVEDEKALFLMMMEHAWKETLNNGMMRMNYLYSGIGDMKSYTDELELSGFEPYADMMEHIVMDAGEAEKCVFRKSVNLPEKHNRNINELSKVIKRIPEKKRSKKLDQMLSDAMMYEAKEPEAVDLSLVYSKLNDPIVALVASGKGKYVYIHYLLILSHNKENKKHVFALMQRMVEKAFEKLGRDIYFICPIRNEKKGRIIGNIIEGYDHKRIMLKSALKSSEEIKLPLEFEEYLFKLYALADALALKSIGTEITIPQIDVPYMQIVSGERECTIYYRRGEEAEKYIVEIATALEEDDMIPDGPGKEERQTYSNKRMLYAERTENPVNDSAVTVETLIMPFLEQVSSIE